MHWFFYLFLTFFILHESWDIFLNLLNRAHLHKHRQRIPEFYQGKIDQATYQKSIDYTLEKSRFGLLTGLLKIPFIWLAIFFGVFAQLDHLLILYVPPGLHHSVVYCAVLGLALMILAIPFSLYSTFVIEEKYGFNKTTLKLFFVDFMKGLILGAVLGIPLLYLVFWLYTEAGAWWWLWAFGSVFGFEMFIAAIYPTLLAPIFNKFTPLPAGALQEAIVVIAKKVNFKMSGIFTIDGSKRSSHSNAYFAGLGRFRRIVLFDTLEKQMTHAEIIGVLAHEMGHNIKKHVQKGLVLSLVASFIGFWILSLLMEWVPFTESLGAGAPSPHKVLVLVGLFSGYFTFLLTPLMNWISRKHEYEADQFSVESTGDKTSLVQALVKLTRENLSNLVPHPLYSFYHYSHPTTAERALALAAHN